MTSRNASFHDRGVAGVLLAPLKWFCISVIILLGLILVAWIVDWIFVFKVWPDGIARLQRILEQDIARTYDIECWCGDLPKLAHGVANSFYNLLFRLSGIHEMGLRFAEGTALSVPDTMVRNAYVANYEGIQVAMLGTQLIGVRLATLVVVLPLIALGYGIAMADGFAQRAIRRVSGGRESSSIYHRAKYLQMVLMVTTGAAFLVLPQPLNPWALCVVILAGEAILARFQWTYYKKHL